MNIETPPVGPLTGGGSHDSREVHLLDRLVTIFRHMRLIVTVFLLVFAAGTLQSFSTIERYRAKATVLIQDERSAIATINTNERAYWEDPEPYFNTQFQILRGRALGRRVVGKLDLASHGLPVAHQNGVVGSVSSLRARLSEALRGVPPSEAPAAEGPPQEAALLGAFLSGVEVTPIKTTRLVEVSYDSTDPQFAALAVNTLVDEYVQQNLDFRLKNTDATLDWLSQQIAAQQAKLREAERAMADYRSDQNALSLDSRQNIVGAQLTQLNDAVTKAKTVRLEKQALYEQVKDLNGQSEALDNVAAVAQNAMVQSLKTQLASLQSERARNAERWGENNPRMIELTNTIASVQSQLQRERSRVLENIRNDYLSAAANERGLLNALEDQKRSAMDLDRKSSSYSVLENEAKSERELFQSLLQQEKELRVVRNSRANNIQFIDRADTPRAPYVPNHRRDLLMSAVLGMALALALAFGIEYLDDTVKNPDDVTRRLNLPLLGLVPAIRGEHAPVLAGDVPHDFGEAFRSLRTSLVFTSPSDRARLLGITSTQPLEGKTTTACNLAMVLAYGGARVLLIDADMRRPGLHRTMGLENEAGLSHVLTGQARVRDVVRHSDDPNLMVITAGRTPPNPSELLSSARMQQMLANLAQGPFDWVIVDTPPVLAVTDAVTLAPFLSGFAFVIGAEMTRRTHVDRAIELLRASRQPIVGVVLNRVDFDRNKYYYSRYYGYHYKSYYGQSAASA